MSRIEKEFLAEECGVDLRTSKFYKEYHKFDRYKKGA